MAMITNLLQFKNSTLALLTGIRSLIDTKLEKTANAVSASRLLTARAISVTGDATWDVSFDGEADVSNILTLADSGVAAGSYGADLETPVLTVDSKGRVISVSNTAIRVASLTETGVVQLSSAVDSLDESMGATPKAVNAAYDLAAAAIPSIEKGAVSGVATLDSNGKLTANQMPSTSANATDAERLGGNLPAFYQDASNLMAGTLPDERLSDTGVIPGDYVKVSVDGKGRIVLGKNLDPVDTPALDASKINSGVFAAARIPTLNQDTTGTAAKWTTPRDIRITGDASWSVSLDGGFDVTGDLILANTGVVAGTYGKLTVDVKGRVVAGAELEASDIPELDAESITSGVFAVERIPTLNQNTTGTASSAAKLTTARNINGVPFDGTVDITAPDQTAFHNGDALLHATYAYAGNYLGRTRAITASGSVTLAADGADTLDVTLTGNAVFTLTYAQQHLNGEVFTASLLVRIRQGAVAYTCTWPNGITWLTSAGKPGAAPAANKIAEFVLTTTDGVSWIGREGSRSS